jgi:hypothetical protein
MSTSNFCGLVSQPTSPPHLSLGEMMWVEDTRAALEEGPAPEKVVRVPIQVEATTTGTLPCTDCSHANEAKPWPEDVPSGGASTPGPLRGLSSWPPRDVALGNSMPVLGSSDVVDLGASELVLPGYPRASPLLPS